MTNKSLLPKIVLLSALLIVGSAFAQELGRRAKWEAQLKAPQNNTPGAEIVSVDASSPLANSGLRPGDLILKVDEVDIMDDQSWTEVSYGIRAAKTTNIEAVRAGKLLRLEVQLNPIPRETHTNIETLYEEVTSPYNITQRVIITRPKAQVNSGAIILIGGLSCSSIEVYPGRNSNWARVINDFVEKSGMVFMRIEKPGVGDSDGDCSKSDFLTDLAGYKAAIELLKSKPYVDPSKIVIYGSSMGSALAPVLANEFDLAGVISDGTFFKTWFEHMLEIERRMLEMKGDSEQEIAQKLNNYYIPLYYGMLIEKMTYKEVTDAYPALRKYNYHSAAHMYGRPVAYYQQLQEFDLASAWENIKVPVRIMRGTNDWIMSAFDNTMIMDVLKKNGHTDHILYEYEGLDHWNTIHSTAKDSFEGHEGRWEDNISMQLIKWAQEIIEDPEH